MRKFLLLFTLFVTMSVYGPEVSAQRLMNRIKKSVEKETEDAISKKLGLKKRKDEPTENTLSEPAQPEENAEVNSNTGRKKIKPPDVKKNISESKASFDQDQYNETRYYLEQALIGVEAEIGYEILKSLPGSIQSLKHDEEYDQVLVTGTGFTGMDIRRTYFNDPKEAEVSVMSSSILAVPLMMNEGGYSEGQKPVRINGYEGKLEAREDGSFYIGLSIGQETIFVLDLMDFNDEEEAIKFAEVFDLDSIKEMLGEQ